MTKLTIRGEAERNVVYDTVELKIRFCSYADSTEEALQKVLSQGENFLQLITEMGIDISDIKLADTSVTQDERNNLSVVIARRTFKLMLAINIPFLNRIIDLIKDNNFSATVSTDYSLKDRDAVYNELMQEALVDSRKKAELIASSFGQKVVGAEFIEHGARKFIKYEGYKSTVKSLCVEEREMRLSDKLEVPMTTESTSIDVVWIVE